MLQTPEKSKFLQDPHSTELSNNLHRNPLIFLLEVEGEWLDPISTVSGKNLRYCLPVGGRQHSKCTAPGTIYFCVYAPEYSNSKLISVFQRYSCLNLSKPCLAKLTWCPRGLTSPPRLTVKKQDLAKGKQNFSHKRFKFGLPLKSERALNLK